MFALLHTLRIIAEMAFRNLFASRWKTVIVGGIIGFGAMLALVGSSLVEAVDQSLGRSVAGSIAGDIQVYSSESKAKLELLGNLVGELPVLAPLEDFAKVRRVLSAIPNVSAVVPMAVSSAVASSGNSVDRALGSLRSASNEWLRDSSDPEVVHRYQSRKAHVRQVLAVLRDDLEAAKRVSARALKSDSSAIEHASSEEFWRDFDRDPSSKLEWLDHEIARLASDSAMVFLLYVGTDPATFSRTFDRMEIVDGEAIPPGKRGFMFSKLAYEDKFKLKAARGLDKLKAAIDERGAKIATDPALQRIVRQNTQSVREVLFQLDALATERFRTKLQGLLKSDEQDVGKLLSTFFATTDATFRARYEFFYRELAPSLSLYRVRVGDMLPLQAYTNNGYVQSANLKVYGTFRFKGLEKSPQAGLVNMMDLVSFRELYGFLTPDRRRELEAMRAAVGARDVAREDAEAELFGGNAAGAGASSADSVRAGAPRSAASIAALQGTRSRREREAQRDYDPKQLAEGAVLSVAVMLRDEGRVAETMRAIERAGAAAGLPLKAATWQESSGIVGQFATLMRAALHAAVLIVFVVALVVISNALLMATLERVREIGTLRAIGAKRRFILSMVLVESLVIGLSAGAIGAGLGWLLLAALGKTGIAATTDAMVFVFAGARLIPSVTPAEFAFALLTVVGVSVASGLYPALLAMRVSPRSAMQTEE